jgi:NAD(P)-dependent dehydrogenase (short-subunit alcohol dehydrogenase family)
MSSHQPQRIALITGSNRGIGLETAQQLAGRGFHVVIAARNEASAQQAIKTIQAKLHGSAWWLGSSPPRTSPQTGAVTFLQLDVSNSTSIHSAAASFAKISNHLDVLINNAGIYPDKGLNILTVPRDHMVQTLQTNTFGQLEVTQAFLPYLRQAPAARVINVSSGLGQLEGLSPDMPSYCLSKLALNGLAIMLAEALKPDNIAVNSMCPGWVRTDMGGPNADRSVQQGADTAIWLATEAPHQNTAKIFRDRQEISW